MKEFNAKYGIKINDAIPEGSCAQEIQAIQSGRGSSTRPDVVDVGESFAVPTPSLFAPYKVATWSNIPAGNKAANGDWYNDYGGYVSFGCDLKVVQSCPTTLGASRGAGVQEGVALNGVPGQAGAATGAVFAAAINNGGSLTNVSPGLTFFNTLKSDRQLQRHRLRLLVPDRGRAVPDHHQLGLPQRRRRVGSSVDREVEGRRPDRHAVSASTTPRRSPRPPPTPPPPVCGRSSCTRPRVRTTS